VFALTSSVGRGGIRAADGTRNGHHETKHRLLRRPDGQDLRLHHRRRLGPTQCHYTPEHITYWAAASVPRPVLQPVNDQLARFKLKNVPLLLC